MLVLARKYGQRIWMDLGDGRAVVIEVVDLRSQCVRLGITAPADVVILREELRDTQGGKNDGD